MIELKMKENGRYYLTEFSDPYSGLAYHEKNGKRISQSTLVDGFRDGEHTVFWPGTGQKRSIAKYREGFRHGLRTDWNEDGDKLAESTYEEDILSGPYRAWFPKSGSIKEEGSYLGGKRHETWITFYDDRGSRKTKEGGGINLPERPAPRNEAQLVK